MSEASNIKVSICCVTYNHRDYIRQCLEGFLMQKTNFAFEILIHDDASTDGTTAIVREYAAAYPGLIRPLIQTENQYSSRTRAIVTTFLLPISRGEYIALCEGDDYWIDPLKLQKQVDVLDKDPGVSLCMHNSIVVFPDGKRKVKKIYRESQQALMLDIIRRKRIYWPTASMVYRKALMDDYPDFCLRSHVGDSPLILYLATRGKVYYLQEDMSVYRKGTPGSHGKRLRANDTSGQQKLIETELEMLDRFNELTDSRYNYCFVMRKLLIQSSVLSRRNGFAIKVYPGFREDFKQVSFTDKSLLLIKIYIVPLLRGRFCKR
ncbi:glycosyltransferase involved in cell wall biosynthesis [Parabacteroides sp. PF5-5]|uniref:glycosyltransferase n=1 Tax=unclassified Parabacteroides TaxID=2649774 RepID=UPI00247429CC|nr:MULTISPECIES: glycosyltransferase [unclassified Parabacteroides]MDH6306112.1 glycosyltransferase involved in cell wall biosynthesis [Parabacteroides sp. PH5-39]MDH6316990.1 glycosyltransferase involved in cell wall biosynthesis [Parabacteroides sp. PF5-13]MDH6320743.1 glycosyltransferase involved in cell wall biosynthesis [Parabacteroides sp. PH5-13]MDH6324555.1 glycosyltransferase involved in cell wall biosynthesis [Parabacteroides sp. PH5-8]MDH6328175.1 glycosyltransferase involved in cel